MLMRAAEDASIVADRLHHRLRRAAAAAVRGLEYSTGFRLQFDA